MLRRLRDHPLIDTLISTKGNARACMWTEPMWGIPFYLYAPYASKYKEAIGLTDTQIGIAATVYVLSQVFWALMGGSLTDKLGRRATTFYFDLLGWAVPMLLWSAAQSFPWFTAAALFNGIWRVPQNSWNMLLAEESPPESLVRLHAVVSVAGLISGFFAPIAFALVRQYDVVPTVRALYLVGGLMMIAKSLIMYRMVRETEIGRRRMVECRGRSVFAHFAGSARVLLEMARDRRIVLTIALVASVNAMRGVNENFWALLITDRLGIESANLSLFSMVKNFLMMVFYFAVVPRVSSSRPGRPLTWALSIWIATQLTLIAMPRNAYALVLLCLAMEALSLTMLDPLVASLQYLALSPERRAQMMALFTSLMLVLTAPFGAITGALSDLNRIYPFACSVALAALALLASRALGRGMAAGSAGPAPLDLNA
ncbi:MAG: MFS transporter [Clostridiales bacterium]|nr:MFS transporter [Clostridiales bacterium]